MLTVMRDVCAIVHSYASSRSRLFVYGSTRGAGPFEWLVYDPNAGFTTDENPDDHIAASGSGSNAVQPQWTVDTAGHAGGGGGGGGGALANLTTPGAAGGAVFLAASDKRYAEVSAASAEGQDVRTTNQLMLVGVPAQSIHYSDHTANRGRSVRRSSCPFLRCFVR